MSKRRGGDRLHGVEVSRRATESSWPDGQLLIRRICVRHEDGRKVCFVPEAGEEFFSRDDAHRVVGILHKGSEVLEWGLELEGQPGTERYPGTGPYDTGAVWYLGWLGAVLAYRLVLPKKVELSSGDAFGADALACWSGSTDPRFVGWFTWLAG